MVAECWVIASLVGFLAFVTGVGLVALRVYLGSRSRGGLLRGWTWLDKSQGSLKQGRRRD
jgi:hypothetical protein